METCKKLGGVCVGYVAEYWTEKLKREKEKLLDAMQAVCDKEENEGGRMLIEQFREKV